MDFNHLLESQTDTSNVTHFEISFEVQPKLIKLLFLPILVQSLFLSMLQLKF